MGSWKATFPGSHLYDFLHRTLAGLSDEIQTGDFIGARSQALGWDQVFDLREIPTEVLDGLREQMRRIYRELGSPKPDLAEVNRALDAAYELLG